MMSVMPDFSACFSILRLILRFFEPSSTPGRM